MRDTGQLEEERKIKKSLGNPIHSKARLNELSRYTYVISTISFIPRTSLETYFIDVGHFTESHQRDICKTVVLMGVSMNKSRDTGSYASRGFFFFA